MQASSLLKRYWSLPGIAAALLLAWYVPEVGQRLQHLQVPKLAVAVIFVLSGLALSLSHVLDDVGRWRCHALIQGASFVMAPVLMALSARCFSDANVRHGLYVVAAVPTTISSCVVFTSLAGGRTACALLNAVGGNVAGVVLSPLILRLMTGTGPGAPVRTGRAMLELGLLVLLPFAVGQIIAGLRPSVRRAMNRIGPPLSQVLILLIMLCAFSGSLHRLTGGAMSRWGVAFAYLAGFHATLGVALLAAVRLSGLRRDESVAVFFCGTQKTLAMGTPLAYAYFADDAGAVGLVLLPLVFYHLFQLVVGNVLAHVWARRTIGPGEETTSL